MNRRLLRLGPFVLIGVLLSLCVGWTCALWSPMRGSRALTDLEAGVVLRAQLDHAGGSARTLQYFARPRDLALPRDPGLKVRSGWHGGRPVVLVTTRALAKNVQLEVMGANGHLADNFFDMLPGERRLVHFVPTGREPIRMPVVSARSLVDAWDDREP